MKISVILPTYIRNNHDATLASLLNQSALQDVYEIVVVVNGSEKEQETEYENVRIFEVPWTGLNNARNFGVEKAKHEIVAFIDDDALASVSWVTALAATHSEHTAPVLGGKVIPKWPKSGKPDWVEGILLDYLSLLDYSSAPTKVHSLDWLAGTNISFKKKIFSSVGGFDSELDRKPGILLSSGEEELCRRIRHKGYDIQYDPKLSVTHVIPSSRLTPNYFIQRAYWQGVSDYIMDSREKKVDEIKALVQKKQQELLPSPKEQNYKKSAKIISLCAQAQRIGYLQAAISEEI